MDSGCLSEPNLRSLNVWGVNNEVNFHHIPHNLIIQREPYIGGVEKRRVVEAVGTQSGSTVITKNPMRGRTCERYEKDQ